MKITDLRNTNSEYPQLLRGDWVEIINKKDNTKKIGIICLTEGFGANVMGVDGLYLYDRHFHLNDGPLQSDKFKAYITENDKYHVNKLKIELLIWKN